MHRPAQLRAAGLRSQPAIELSELGPLFQPGAVAERYPEVTMNFIDD
jgi:hypothetical protein